MFAIGIGPGDEVIVPPITFAATANAVVYQGGTPVFVDVDPGTLLIDPASAAAAITPKTRAIVGVDYAGQPCDYDALRTRAIGSRRIVARRRRVPRDRRARRARPRRSAPIADLSVFSFHPVKHVATAEGGAVTTSDAALARADAHVPQPRHHGRSPSAQRAGLVVLRDSSSSATTTG